MNDDQVSGDESTARTARQTAGLIDALTSPTAVAMELIRELPRPLSDRIWDCICEANRAYRAQQTESSAIIDAMRKRAERAEADLERTQQEVEATLARQHLGRP